MPRLKRDARVSADNFRANERRFTRDDCDPEDRAHGLTFSEWLHAAGRRDSASEYNLREAWRAGEDPAEYEVGS